MKRFVSGSVVVLLLMVLAAPASAEGQGASGWQQFKQDVKETGRKIGKAGKDVGHGVADGAKKGGRAVKEFFTGKGGGSK